MTVTIKLNEVAEAALRAASERTGRSVADLVLQAIGLLIAREAARPSGDGDAPVTSAALQAYWARNPDPDEAIEDFIAGEVSGFDDPVEGVLVEVSRSTPTT
jgi:hypothetical protein